MSGDIERLYSYLHSNGLYSYGLYRYGLHSYGLRCLVSGDIKLASTATGPSHSTHAYTHAYACVYAHVYARVYAHDLHTCLHACLRTHVFARVCVHAICRHFIFQTCVHTVSSQPTLLCFAGEARRRGGAEGAMVVGRSVGLTVGTSVGWIDGVVVGA